MAKDETTKTTAEGTTTATAPRLVITPAVMPEDAVKLAGGWEGAFWLPQYSELNEKRKAAQLQKSGPMAFCDPLQIAGVLITPMAYGRTVFALDKVDGCPVPVKLPEHATLYSALNGIKVGARVWIAYKGPSEKSNAGRQPAILYDVRCGKSDVHPDGPKRADAVKLQPRDAPEGDEKSNDETPF